MIQSTTKGARRVYYPADAPIPENGGGLHEVQTRLLKHVEEVPGMTVKDLAGVLGVSSQLAMYHVRKLVAERLLRVERQGMRFRVYAAAEERRPKGPPEDT